MESGLKKVLGDSTGEEVYGIANLLAISVAAPEMAENGVNLLKNGVNLLKDGTNLLKNGVNLIKDVIGAAKDFIKENKLEIGFHEIAGIGGVRSPYINFIQKEKEDISSIKTIENIEKVDEWAADAERVVNGKGNPYPKVEVEGHGEVPFPEGPYEPNNSETLRPKFTDSYKK